MAANPYTAAPLYAALVDPATGRLTRAFFFLGAAPKAVLAAARRRTGADPCRPAWGAADAATLRAFYGPQWRALLTPQDPPAADAEPSLPGWAPHMASSADTGWGEDGGGWGPPGVDGEAAWGAWTAPGDGAELGADEVAPGGAGAAEPGAADEEEADGVRRGGWGAAKAGGAAEEADFGDLRAFDEPYAAPAAAAAAAAAEEAGGYAARGAGLPEYTDLAVYPEDTLLDLRNKLGQAAGVPLGRQHFWYHLNEGGALLPYRLTADGAPVAADWRALRRAAGAGTLAGLAVDAALEARREGLQVEAYDTFRVLRPAAGVRVTRAYAVDLYAVVPPLGAPERPADGLADVLRDQYAFDLLYYGALLRYWPQLAPEAARLALAEPGRLRGAFPALDPEPRAQGALFAEERALADAAHAWRPEAAGGPGRGGAPRRAEVAVTAATARTRPAAARMRVDVRTAFDWLPAEPPLLAAAVRFAAEAAEVAGPEGRQGGTVAAVATKRHASSYVGPLAPAVEAFLGCAPCTGVAAFALARGGARGAPPTLARLTLHDDGRVAAAAAWREDDRVGFAQAAAELEALAAPVVAAVNALGPAVFPVGGALAAGGEGGGTRLGRLTASAFWPHPLTGAAFRELRARFRPYERAGLARARPLQQAGAFALSWRKGVTAYDTCTLRCPGAPANQYAWLCEPGAAARWAAAFPGRAVRLHHRTADLRVEVVGAEDLAEFELIRRYLFSFLDGLPREAAAAKKKAGPGAGRAAAPPAARARPGKGPAADAEEDGDGDGDEAGARRLRRLQERDPELFDLKKHDPAATVYARLCQARKQPRAFSAEEAAALPGARRKALTPYWNFTEGVPAYYECPGPAFPHLRLRAGAHPRGYCLPCCNQARAAPGSRAAAEDAACLAAVPGAAGGPGPKRDGPAPPPAAPEPAELLARHVLAYGKAVPPGRLGAPPAALAEGLFLGALAAPLRLQAVGVEQAAPAVPDGGYAYALAYALGGDEEAGGVGGDAALEALAAAARAAPEHFFALGGGAGGAFASAEDLADALAGAFVRREAALSPLGPGGAVAEGWRPLLADLARQAFGVEVVLFVDGGGGALRLEAAPAAAAALTGRGALPGAAPPRLALLQAGPAGTYPLAALDPARFLRGRTDRVRRTFDAGDPLAARVVEAIRGALLAQEARAPPAPPGLGALARFAAEPGAPFALETRLADLRGRCYAVVLRRAEGGDLAYLAVPYAPCPADGTPTVYGARPQLRLPKAAQDAAVAAVNAYVRRAEEGCAPYAPEAVLVDAEGRAVGFAAGGLCSYHDPAPPSAGDRTPRLPLPYDPREVDLAVAERLRAGPPAPGPLEAAAAAAAHRNSLYRLFLAEFSALLRADRDRPLRARLARAVEGTRFAAPESVAALRRGLGELLREHPGDLRQVWEAVGHATRAAPQDPRGAALAALDAARFAFDRHTLARLRALGSHAEAAAEVRRLMAPRVELVPPGAPEAARAPPNIFAACAEEGKDGAARKRPGAARPGHQSQCAGGRLVVPEDRFADLCDILAADARSASKGGLLAAASAGVFDPLAFVRRPGEHLEVALAP